MNKESTATGLVQLIPAAFDPLTRARALRKATPMESESVALRASSSISRNITYKKQLSSVRNAGTRRVANRVW